MNYYGGTCLHDTNFNKVSGTFICKNHLWRKTLYRKSFLECGKKETENSQFSFEICLEHRRPVLYILRLQIRRPTSFLQLLETIGVLIIFLLGLLSFYSITKCALETTFSLFEESNLKIFKEDLSTIAISILKLMKFGLQEVLSMFDPLHEIATTQINDLIDYILSK